ncbi:MULTISPECIES: TetR/AcrR family transcriptional regulator [unclassified Novosphingobium]|uniref:TetR/AcrR family transcriptional regulator n=1 Tax=unclassified Novosphingobium TaxID=2644732 RepID=UPI000F5F2DC1|nr:MULTISPECIES: TetR/AcrR family transcriptional regulator [unclassified Novosphingobium]MBF5091701.1 TetR/AcrR family transcriptional regulator [Novosphingobium sp. NBM11]RQW39259.1 TetR/AcrR family transcriptional regulator [Novosphingobium sp. LASN5T]
MTEEGEIPFAMSGRKPVQKRAQATWNRLLDAAGSLLEEVGVERISTNLVAARAGVSPPTLYHYFPDKYALLAALGERLMVAQNALVVLDPEQDEAAIAAVLEAHVTLTRATPGGAWIMRMLRAVPQLAPIRIASHRAVARALAERVLALDPRQDPQSTEARARLCVDLGYAAIELIFDEPDLPEAPALADAARAIRAVIAP